MVGVGLMGHGIAGNIVRKGFGLSYLRHPGNRPTDDLDAAGARGFDTAAEMAGQCDIVVLVVSGSPQVEDVLTGSGKMLEALRPGMVVIDCSTADPASTARMAELVRARGADMVDAAMTRTPKEAAEGRLNLLVGGAPDTVARVRPLLETFSENIFLAGGVSTGHQLKLIHNFVSVGSVALMAEAAACAAQGGIAMDALVECLAKGGGGGVALQRIGPYLTEGETAQMRFSIANGAKDISYYAAMAAAMGAADGIAKGVSATLTGLVERGEGEAFMPQAATLLQTDRS